MLQLLLLQHLHVCYFIAHETTPLNGETEQNQLNRLRVQYVIVVQERSVFQRIVMKSAYNRRKMYEKFLESVPLLKSLNVCVKPKVGELEFSH